MNPAYDHLLGELRDLRSKREALTAQIHDNTQKAIKLGIEGLFQAHPDLKTFCWTQRESEYDDEGPDWGVSMIWLDHAGHKERTDYYYYGQQMPDRPVEWQTLRDEVSRFLNEWDEEAMFALFGGWNIVQATRQGVEIHEYEEFDPETDA